MVFSKITIGVRDDATPTGLFYFDLLILFYFYFFLSQYTRITDGLIKNVLGGVKLKKKKKKFFFFQSKRWGT